MFDIPVNSFIDVGMVGSPDGDLGEDGDGWFDMNDSSQSVLELYSPLLSLRRCKRPYLFFADSGVRFGKLLLTISRQFLPTSCTICINTVSCRYDQLLVLCNTR